MARKDLPSRLSVSSLGDSICVDIPILHDDQNIIRKINDKAYVLQRLPSTSGRSAKAPLFPWDFLAGRFSSVCRLGPGQPPLPTRLVAGLFILKHMHNLSDEALCDRWVENPYFQYFCGEVVFRHDLPFDRSSLTRWRQRLGEEQIAALLQESLSVAHRTGAIETKDLERVVVDTTVQEKAIAHPSDARLMHRAIEKLVDLAKREGIELRQSYLRVAKRAGAPALEDRFGPLLDLAHRVRHQEQRQRGPKVYSLHAPEVECIGKGKARAPYEFGCKVRSSPADFIICMCEFDYDGPILRHHHHRQRRGLRRRFCRQSGEHDQR